MVSVSCYCCATQTQTKSPISPCCSSKCPPYKTKVILMTNMTNFSSLHAKLNNITICIVQFRKPMPAPNQKELVEQLCYCVHNYEIDLYYCKSEVGLNFNKPCICSKWISHSKGFKIKAALLSLPTKILYVQYNYQWKPMKINHIP